MSENANSSTFKPTRVYSRYNPDNPNHTIDLGIVVMLSIGLKELNYPLRNEFYLNGDGDLVYETYSTVHGKPIATTTYKVVKD